MIVDFHTHCFPDKIAERAVAQLAVASGNATPAFNGTAQGLLDLTHSMGVDIDVVLGNDEKLDIASHLEKSEVGDIMSVKSFNRVLLHNTGKAQNSSGSENGVIRKFITTSNLYWNRFDFSKVNMYLQSSNFIHLLLLHDLYYQDNMK